MRNSYKIFFLVFIFLIFSTYNTKYNRKVSSIVFPVKQILIENNLATDPQKLKYDFNFLMNKSLLFLNEDKIFTTFNKYDFISNIQLKKKYPNTLKIIIFEKIPVALQIIGKKKFFVTKENKKIKFTSVKIYENLPLIFGKYKNFDVFYNDLEKNNFNIKSIKAFYYFDVGRWDIMLKNNKIIKLPENNYIDLLPEINLMLNDTNFSKYKVFDFRLKNQLILK
jgi:cell division septal protein FtsQ|tara:strand:+ start:3420 stop:4088 length:669 start_codon:yes stop_codon:yes gene_type:complete